MKKTELKLLLEPHICKESTETGKIHLLTYRGQNNIMFFRTAITTGKITLILMSFPSVKYSDKVIDNLFILLLAIRIEYNIPCRRNAIT